MKKLLIAAILFLSATPAYALLSPLNQSVAEIQAIVESPELGKYIPQSQPILVIHRIEEGYLIMTNQLEMTVDVEYQKTTKPGPQKFDLNFHEPIPLSQRR